MRILAFDTCLNACSVAVTDAAGHASAALCERMRQGHAERLCPMIEEVIAEAGTTLSTLDAIAVTVGPGTFTGIRVGIAAARGFALATNVPVLGATSLSLLAATARASLDEADRKRPIAVCHDARKGEVLLEILCSDAPASLSRVQLLTPAAAAWLIADTAPGALLVGSAAVIVAEAAALNGTRLEITLPDLEPDARHLAGMPLTPLASPTPLYPRAPDALPPRSPSLQRLV